MAVADPPPAKGNLLVRVQPSCAHRQQLVAGLPEEELPVVLQDVQPRPQSPIPVPLGDEHHPMKCEAPQSGPKGGVEATVGCTTLPVSCRWKVATKRRTRLEIPGERPPVLDEVIRREGAHAGTVVIAHHTHLRPVGKVRAPCCLEEVCQQHHVAVPWHGTVAPLGGHGCPQPHSVACFTWAVILSLLW